MTTGVQTMVPTITTLTLEVLESLWQNHQLQLRRMDHNL